ncbi:MAG: autotransporter outer membrane beta-barrel domain-containing protein, partial [Afipia sp.]|nr:autotransporter outer membrane beta-barrel domain-containing protein [Afipia sp.]
MSDQRSRMIGAGVVSLRVRGALGFRGRMVRAARYLFAIVAIGAFANVMMPNDARAQFACNGVSPSATDLTCTNSGTETNAVSTTSTISGAQAVTVNSGLVQGNVETLADGGGNATSHNSNSIEGSLFTQTSNGALGFGGGNAATYNSGIVDAIATVTQDGGNALTVNSGRVLDLAGVYPSFSAALATVAAFGGDATTINSGFVAGDIFTASALVTGNGSALTVNSGWVSGAIQTIAAVNGNSTNINSGSVFGGMVGVVAGDGNAAAINFGYIGGPVASQVGGIGNASLVNYGTIDSGSFGSVLVQTSSGTASVFNAGRIVGTVGVSVFDTGHAVITNAGLIDGSASGSAILMDTDPSNPAARSTLNILPGSRIIGTVALAGDASIPGSGTTVNILSGHDISSVLTFGDDCGCGTQGGLIDTGSIVNVTGGAPYVINGNMVAVLDPTSFAAADRNVVDVTRTITSLVTSRLTNPAPIGGNGSAAIGFAPSGNVARDMANDAFSGIPALAYASNDRVLLSNPSFTAADGTSIWAQGFGGQRIQQADAPTLRSVSNFYGGVLGIDKTVQPGLRVGGFIGGGAIKSTIDLNSGDTSSDIGFGGLYGRYAMGRAFLDFSLLGGYSSNDVKR